MPLYTICVSGLWALAATGLTWYCSTVARQMTYVTLSDGRRQERRLPLLFRLLLPLTSNLEPLFARSGFAVQRQAIQTRLISAGYEGLLNATEFLALRVILPAVSGLFWCLLMLLLVSSANLWFLQKMQVSLCIIGVLWFVAYPTLWLRNAITMRHRAIQRALPFVLDILTLSVEAGMDFMTALRRHVERAELNPLNEELLRVIREIQLGKTRREALRDMSHRVNFADLRAIVNALVQADELGVSIGSILRIQSDQIRQRRFDRAEKQAHEAPVKLLFPLLLFIFPSVFFILLGPIVRQIVAQGF